MRQFGPIGPLRGYVRVHSRPWRLQSTILVEWYGATPGSLTVTVPITRTSITAAAAREALEDGHPPVALEAAVEDRLAW